MKCKERLKENKEPWHEGDPWDNRTELWSADWVAAWGQCQFPDYDVSWFYKRMSLFNKAHTKRARVVSTYLVSHSEMAQEAEVLGTIPETSLGV